MPQPNVTPESPASPGSTGAPRPLRKRWGIVACFVTFMHILGVITSVHAIMSTRTSQGAIAWAVSANAIPYVAVPAYWVFGQSKFDGYDMSRFTQHHANSPATNDALERARAQGFLLDPANEEEAAYMSLLEELSGLPVTTQNSAQLLIDGKQTFAAIGKAIEQAEAYILFQFYILRDDGLGRELAEALVDRAQDGVSVYVLYDEVGSKDLSRTYIDNLRKAGVEVAAFNTSKDRRFQLNFRNHRKTVVVDGKVAFVGGHNVGDEYLGKHPTLTPWRDTHVELRGPVVQCVQVPFYDDWHWATNQKLTLDWQATAAPGGTAIAACIPTGPADKLESGTLFFLHAINSAQKRLWIVSPYFIPDEQLMSALQLAALRGVDVRILIPENPDHLHVYWSGLSYLEEAEEAGIAIYRYKHGFLHQKVMLIDDYAAAVGTANLDNRSMRLNFEMTALILDEAFASKVEQMLVRDFDAEHASLTDASEYRKRSLPYRFLVRISRLLAPVQ